jgi:hypothetical protein
MKGNSQTAVYLTCTKNKSLQRKHVEVCKRCKSSSRCKPYLEYRQNVTVENAAETATDIDRSQLLRHIIQELQEIKQLTLTDTVAPPEPYLERRPAISGQKLRIGDIRTAIKEIQLLCK